MTSTQIPSILISYTSTWRMLQEACQQHRCSEDPQKRTPLSDPLPFSLPSLQKKGFLLFNKVIDSHWMECFNIHGARRMNPL